MAKNIPNGHKIYQMAKNIPNGHKTYKTFPFQDFEKMGFSVYKYVYHLATLLASQNYVSPKKVFLPRLFIDQVWPLKAVGGIFKLDQELPA
jgi:hypothetical protein